MPTPPKGSELDFTDIEDEFGQKGGSDLSMSEYYGDNVKLPRQGIISTEDFGALYGPDTITFTVAQSPGGYGYNYSSSDGSVDTRTVKEVTNNIESVEFTGSTLKMSLGDATQLNYIWKIDVEQEGAAGTDTYFPSNAQFNNGTWTWQLGDGSNIPEGIWELQANADGTARMSHPDGDFDKPVDNTVPAQMAAPYVVLNGSSPTSSVNIVWDSDWPNTTHVNLEYSTNDQNWMHGVRSTSWGTSISGLEENTTYYFRTVAENATGYAEPSDSSYVTTEQTIQDTDPDDPTPQEPADWQYNLDAEPGADDWTWKRESTIGTKYVHSGTRAWKCICPADPPGQGWNYWGLDKDFDTWLGKGDIVHVRWAVFWPQGTEYWDVNPWLKFTRMSCVDPNGASDGYHDITLRTDGSIWHSMEGGQRSGVGHSGNFSTTSSPLQVGKWEVYEWEIGLDNKPRHNGGGGYSRIWQEKNGEMVLIGEESFNTLHKADYKISKFMIFAGTWNDRDDLGDGRPKSDQECWVDSVYIETDMSKLTKLDANGYKIMGGSVGSTPTDPDDPRVQPAAGSIAGYQLLLQDGFESGDFSHTGGGFAWGSETATNGSSSIAIEQDTANYGTNSLRLRYDGTAPGVASKVERHFDLGSYYDKSIIEFDWYVPSNFEFRESGPLELLRLYGSSRNNKSVVGLNIQKGSGTVIGDAYIVRGLGSASEGPDLDNPIRNLITSNDIGQWMTLRFELIAPTASTYSVVKIYKNGTLLKNLSLDTYVGNDPQGFKNGFVGGNCSFGFDSQTDFFIDNFKAYSDNKVIGTGNPTDITRLWYPGSQLSGQGAVLVEDLSDGTQITKDNNHGLLLDSVDAEVTNNVPFFDGGNTVEDYIAGGVYSGRDPWMQFGFIKDVSNIVSETEEAWFRVYTYYPEGFDFDTPGGADKLSFFGHRDQNGSPTVTTYISRGNASVGQLDGRWMGRLEGIDNGPENGWWRLDNGENQPVRNQWECYEMYIKFSSGSDGLVKLWKNNGLIGEFSGRTLGSGGEPNDIRFHVWWDGSVPKNQTFYWTKPAIAIRGASRDDTEHMTVDTTGFPIIGKDADHDGTSNPVPDRVSDLRAVALSTNTIELNWTAIPNATEYEISITTDFETINYTTVSSNYYRYTNLTEDTQYWFAVVAKNANGSSENSNLAGAKTQGIPTASGGLLLTDDFSSFNVGEDIEYKTPSWTNPEVSGIQWRHNAGSPVLVGTGGRSGSNCLHFNFSGGNDNDDNTGTNGASYCEQQIRLCNSQGTAHQELWLEFYMMASDMPRMEPPTGGVKIVSFHNDNWAVGGRSAYGRMNAIFGTTNNGNQGRDRKATLGHYHYTEAGGIDYSASGHEYDLGSKSYPPYGKGYPGGTSSWYENYRGCRKGDDTMILRAQDANKWVRFRFHMKLNDIGQANGLYEAWRDDTKVLYVPQLYREWKDGYNKCDGLYFLGWAGHGFQSKTTWKIDDVKFWNEDPNWSFGGGTGPDPDPGPQPAPKYAPTSFRVDTKSTTTVDLKWDTWVQDGANATEHYTDFEDDSWKDIWRSRSEGPGITGTNRSYGADVATDIVPRRGARSLKFDFDYPQNRQEIEYMEYKNGAEEYGDFNRFEYGTDYAIGYSYYLPTLGSHKSYQVMGQIHGSNDNTLNEVHGISPIWATKHDLGTGTRAFARFDNKAVSDGDNYTTLFNWDGGTITSRNEHDRWLDVVWRFRFDPTGANSWPDDGTGPYTGFIEYYRNGELIESDYNVGLGRNDGPGREHWLRLGVYCGWKEGKTIPTGGWGATRRIAYYDTVSISKGSAATFGNVSPSGPVKRVYIEENVASVWTPVTDVDPAVKGVQITGLTTGTTHTYRIKALDIDGSTYYINPNTITVTTL